MASTYLSKTFASSGNRQRQTISVWVKRGNLGISANIFSVYYNASIWGNFYFNSSDQLKYYNNGGAYDLTTNRKFRDTNAWYHIVIQLNTTEATASDRIKMYVNGVQETSFASTTYPTLNAEVTFGDNYSHYIGTYNAGTDNFDGSMSHFHFITNTAYDATAFGQADANGVWTINTSPSVTYGTNGFFILEDGNSVTDQSGNGNNFTVAGGTLTNTEDNPSNVFATLNPLWRSRWVNDQTFSNGNTTMTNTSIGGGYGMSTLAVTSGKWYWEVKAIDITRLFVGVGDGTFIASKDDAFQTFNPSNAVGFYCSNGTIYYNATTNTSYYGSAISNNDIVQVALDMDNHLLWFGLNGTWMNSATQTEIENGTATNDVTTAIGTQNVINNGEPINFFVADTSGSGVGDAQTNFGNGYFGTTAVASAGTNASGIGIFEYDVPTGYTALSTKGLDL